MVDAMVRAEKLTRHYRVRQGWGAARKVLRALDGVSFEMSPGRTLAVVGESGCGKSTLGKLVAQIEPATSGRLWLDGAEVSSTARTNLVRVIFQNPYGSLNRRMPAGRILEEPLRINTHMSAAERRDAVHEMLVRVGLHREHGARYPHMLSGGQRQRVAIARALMLRPKVVVADEPLAALDLSLQSQLLNLLRQMQDDFGVAYLFISHSLDVVEYLSDDVMVLYLGRVVEQGPINHIFRAPQHPYTQALLGSRICLDTAGRRLPAPVVLKSELPSPLDPPRGCAFHPRCPIAMRQCEDVRPELKPDANGALVACHAVD